MPLSPFAQPISGLRIKEGVPGIKKPRLENQPFFEAEAKRLFEKYWQAQSQFIKKSEFPALFNNLAGKHFIVAGGTGLGIGYAIVVAILRLLENDNSGSLTVISRDLPCSLEIETGKLNEKCAHFQLGTSNQQHFHWSNKGLSRPDGIIMALQNIEASEVIYINTIAAAYSGLLPSSPPIYIKDIDKQGIFQWELPCLTDKQIAITKSVMGTMSVNFIKLLTNKGIDVELAAFADWRGSLDVESRNPENAEYGKWGAYSTSLWLPKYIVRQHALRYDNCLVFFLPTMNTRALSLIPGGRLTYEIYGKLMKKHGVRRIGIPELAMKMLEYIGRAIASKDRSIQTLRLDEHEASLDQEFFKIILGLESNNDLEKLGLCP